MTAMPVKPQCRWLTASANAHDDGHEGGSDMSMTTPTPQTQPECKNGVMVASLYIEKKKDSK